MNSTNSFTVSQLYLQMFPASIFMFFIGLLGCVGNLILVLITAVAKTLKSNSHFLVKQKAIANSLSCAYFAYFGIIGVIKIWTGDLVNLKTNRDCVVEAGFHIASNMVNALLVLVIAIDRFVGISFSTLYLSTPRFVFQMVVVMAWIYGFSHMIITFFYSNMEPMPICLTSASLTGFSAHIWKNSLLVVNILVLIVYTATIYKTATRLKVWRRLSDNSGSYQTFKGHLAAIRSLTLIVAVYLFTWVATVISLKISSSITDRKSLLVLLGYLGIPAVSDASSDFPILVWRARDYRKATVQLLKFRQITRPFTSMVLTSSRRPT